MADPATWAAIAGIVGGVGTAYNSLVSQPQQAEQQLGLQKEAYRKASMSQFLKDQIARQQGMQMQNMVAGYNQPNFLEKYLQMQSNRNYLSQSNYNQGGW